MKFIVKKILNMLLIASEFSPFVLLWVAKAFIIDWPLRKWSFLQFPRKAEKMGLHYIESDHVNHFGIIKGKARGYYLEIKPDDSMNSSIRVRMHKKDDNLEISLGKPSLRPKKNIREFVAESWEFNWAFKTKRAHVNSITFLTERNEFVDSLVAFYSRWIFALDTLNIDYGEIFCKFKYGFNFFPYIPVYRIEKIVEQLVTIAEKHDELFGR